MGIRESGQRPAYKDLSPGETAWDNFVKKIAHAEWHTQPAKSGLERALASLGDRPLSFFTEENNVLVAHMHLTKVGDSPEMDAQFYVTEAESPRDNGKFNVVLKNHLEWALKRTKWHAAFLDELRMRYQATVNLSDVAARKAELASLSNYVEERALPNDKP